MGRAPCCDKAVVKRGPWSPEEDMILKSYIHKHGTGGNWISFPRKAGLNRCGKSCRLRWLNYLRPDIKHGGFTNDEEAIICNLYSTIGSRWSIIASQLPGRTDNDIKNYWNTKLKKKIMAVKKSAIFTNNVIPTDDYGLPPYFPIDFSYHENFVAETENQLLPLPDVVDVSDISGGGCSSSNYNIVSATPDGSMAFSGSSSSQVLSGDMSNPNVAGEIDHIHIGNEEHDHVVMDTGFDQISYFDDLNIGSWY